MTRDDWGPVRAGLVRRDAAGPAAAGAGSDPGPAFVVSGRLLRVIEAQAQTLRARVVTTRVRLTPAPSSPMDRLTDEQLDAQLSLVDEGLRELLTLVREATRAPAR